MRCQPHAERDMSFHVTIRSSVRQVDTSAEEGESLLSVIRREGFAVTAACGGRGACGKCTVMLITGEKKRRVLSCRNKVTCDCVILTEEIKGGAILYDKSAAQETPAVSRELAAAMDLGTTTVVVELIDLSDGSSRGTAAEWNAQAPYGADVISRAQYCAEHSDGLQTLKNVIRRQTEELLKRLGTDRSELKTLFVAGNTIMQHIYAGLDPLPIARAPFTPEAYFTGDEPEESGIAYSPCVAGYVGGDITAGLLASGLFEREERSLYLDIGTNGEMAIGGAEGFLCCAVASGPAFEGAGIACGMPALEGTVSHVYLEDNDLRYEVIGGGPAKGICGSGLIDLLAILCRLRIVSGTGRLLGPDDTPEGFEKYLEEDENGNGVFYLTEDHSVFLTASDVRQLQLAKAAVAAGIQVLLKKSGICVDDLERLYIAGGFGNYMDPGSAADIGMLPEKLRSRIVLLGNASLVGARMALTDQGARGKLFELRDACRYVELSGDPDFNEEFTEQMYFYEEDE